MLPCAIILYSNPLTIALYGLPYILRGLKAVVLSHKGRCFLSKVCRYIQIYCVVHSRSKYRDGLMLRCLILRSSGSGCDGFARTTVSTRNGGCRC